jgi:hypothetical protein
MRVVFTRSVFFNKVEGLQRIRLPKVSSVRRCLSKVGKARLFKAVGNLATNMPVVFDSVLQQLEYQKCSVYSPADFPFPTEGKILFTRLSCGLLYRTIDFGNIATIQSKGTNRRNQ